MPAPYGNYRQGRSIMCISKQPYPQTGFDIDTTEANQPLSAAGWSHAAKELQQTVQAAPLPMLDWPSHLFADRTQCHCT
jgi:hypothetical protein